MFFICDFSVSAKCNYSGWVGDNGWSEGGASWGDAEDIYGRGRSVGGDGVREGGGDGRGHGCMSGAWAGERVERFGRVRQGGCEGVAGRGRYGELLGRGSFVYEDNTK